MNGRQWATWREFPLEREKPPKRVSAKVKDREGKEHDLWAMFGYRAPSEIDIDDTDSVSDWRPV